VLVNPLEAVMEFRRRFPAGALVFSEGDPGDCAYIVEAGEVDITVADGDQHLKLATRVPGELFGEMAIIDDKPRSASARAVADCTLLMITRDQLNQRIARTDPILRMCINVVLDHLRSTLRRLTSDAEMESGTQQVSESARKEALSAIRLEQELQTAIEEEQFELWYQPLIDLREGHIAGFEALIRWRHPERGLVPPGAFIPAAERCGLIVMMTRWAFRTACEQLRRFGDDTFMSVNFSGKDFASPGFVENIEETLREVGIPPPRVKLEITESLLMHSPDTARKILAALRDRGASIAIDDFGTGYSSLSYLHSLPADTLKIDQSFVRAMFDDESNRSLVRSIVGLAKGLSMRIVAEGIEEAPQAHVLRELGVDYGQGWLFSRARPAADIEQLVAEWTPPEY